MVQHAPWLRGGASRIVFKPLAGDFGETVVLILDYAGPAIATFMTLRHGEASLRGPARAALSLTSHGSGGVSRTTMCNILHDGFSEDVPPALRIIGQQPRGILAAMTVSDAPVHVTRALAGCGKSAVLQRLVEL